MTKASYVTICYVRAAQVVVLSCGYVFARAKGDGHIVEQRRGLEHSTCEACDMRRWSTVSAKQIACDAKPFHIDYSYN